MLKNNKGVTLALLIITIIVILILASITISASDSVLTRTRLQTAVANMKIIQAKAESMYEEYSFNATPEEDYIGKEVTDVGYLNMYGVAILPDDKWRVWDREILAELGFDADMLKEVKDEDLETPIEQRKERYIVNYVTGEVIFTTGVEDENDERVYTVNQITDTLYVKKDANEVDEDNIVEPETTP